MVGSRAWAAVQSSFISPVYFRHQGDKDDANCKRNYLTALYYV